MTQLTEQIRQQLVTDILEGRYVPGSAFPTELETAERFRVSRVTVRRASRDFLKTICAEASKQGVMTVLEPGGDSGEEQSRAALRLAAGGVRNIVVWGVDRKLDFGLFHRLRVLGVNQVFFDRILPGEFADYVGLDNRGALETLIDCAVKDGAADFIFLDAAGLDVDSQRERRESFIAACRRQKLPHRLLELPWAEVLSHKHI